MFRFCSMTIFPRPVYFLPTKCKVNNQICVSLYEINIVSPGEKLCILNADLLLKQY